VSALTDFRKAISDRPVEFLALIRATEEAVDKPVTAELYKRPKITDNPDLEPYFAWKTYISCTWQEEIGPDTFGPQLADRVREKLEKLIPLYEYFTQFTV
jgi:hypothetical protein